MNGKKLKKKFVISLSFMMMFMFTLTTSISLAAPSARQSFNYAKSTESAQIRYDGYIQFVPNYTTNEWSGYYLQPGRNVKQAYINYTRNGSSVIGGRKYTSISTSGSHTVSTSASCWDSLIPGDQHTTKFSYGWVYR